MIVDVWGGEILLVVYALIRSESVRDDYVEVAIPVECSKGWPADEQILISNMSKKECRAINRVHNGESDNNNE